MKNIRKMYRLKWSSGKYHEDFCELCANKAAKEDYIERSFEIKTGTCHTCGYERDEEVIRLEKIENLNWRLEEMEQIVKDIKTTDRKIVINSLKFQRKEKVKNLQQALQKPKKLIKNLQLDIELEKQVLIKLIRKQEKKIIERIENLKSKTKTPV